MDPRCVIVSIWILRGGGAAVVAVVAVVSEGVGAAVVAVVAVAVVSGGEGG